MKRALLTTAAVLAVLAGINAASAQTGGVEPRGMQNPSSSGGSAPQSEDKLKAGVHAQGSVEKAKVEPGGGAASTGPKEKMGSGKVQTQHEDATKKPGQTGIEQNKKEQSSESSGQSQSQPKNEQRATGQSTSTPKEGGMQKGDAAKTVQLSTEQRGKIRTTIVDQKVERVTNVNFSISVGERIPRTVHYYPLPASVFVIVPEYEGYDYILVGDEILIIDPRTLEIVAVLPA